jgi:hypothetical protein
VSDQEIRAALNQHWAASDANDFATGHLLYHDDAILEYPQSGERIRGRSNIQITRSRQPNKKRFTLRRIIGSGDLWITEYILSYDGKPSYTVSIMEFRNDKVARENAVLFRPIRARRTTKNGGALADSAIPARATLHADQGHPHSNCIGASIRWNRSRA